MSNTPEHDKRTGSSMLEPMHPELMSAYTYVHSVVDTADGQVNGAPLWYGWALREAFLAGISYANKEKVTP